jgi:hypothetical protein
VGSGTSISGQNDLVVDAVIPAILDITSSKANGAYTEDEEFIITVTFSENVNLLGGTPTIALNSGGTATYTGGTGTDEWTFAYTVGAGQNTEDLDADTANSLALNGATIRDAALNNANLTLRTGGAAGSLATNKAIIIDTTVGTVLNVVSTNATRKLGDSFFIDVVFSERVYRTGNPQLNLDLSGGRVAAYHSLQTTTVTEDTVRFTYTVQAGDSSADLAYEDANALDLNAGTLNDRAGNALTLTLPNPAAAGSLDANQAIVLDGVVPTITSVDADEAMDIIHKIGDEISFRINFSENVSVVDGGLELALQLDSGVVEATCPEVANTAVVACSYTVVDGDERTAPMNYVGVNSLTQAVGTTTDAAGNSATLTLPGLASGNSLGELNSIGIDGIMPTIVEVTSPTDDGIYGEDDPIAIHVIFSENVSLTAGSLELRLDTGDVDADISCASVISGNTLVCSYTVAASDQSADLNYDDTDNLSLNGATFVDGAGNDINLTLPDPEGADSLGGNKNLIIIGTPVGPASVSSPASDGTYKLDDELDIEITFNGPVTVTTTGGTPTLTLETGGSDGVATYISGSGTSVLTFRYTVAAGHTSGDLDYESNAALALNGGVLSDAAGIALASLALPNPGAAGSLASSKNIAIDAVVGTISGVDTTNDDGKLVIGDQVVVTLAGSKDIFVTGSPRILLEMGDTDRYATYWMGSGSPTLLFRYTIQEGDVSADLDYVATDSLELNGGTIRDDAGNNFVLTLANPGAAGSLGNAAALVVDGIRPEVTHVVGATADGTYQLGDTIEIEVHFDTAVWVTGVPTLALETGDTDRTASYTGGSGTTTLTFEYTVQSSDNTNDLNYVATDSLALSGGTITDAVAAPRNAASLTLPATGGADSLAGRSAIVIDGIVPSILDVTSAAANAPTRKIGDEVEIQVVFSETVTVNVDGGAPTLLLETGTSDTSAVYSSGSGSSTLVFTYTVAEGDETSDLNYQSVNALVVPGGSSIRDGALNDATLTLPGLASEESLASNKEIAVDGVRAVVTNVTSDNNNGLYTTAGQLFVDITFDKVVTVTGNPTLALNSGDGVVATYVSGSPGSTLRFSYTIAPNQYAADLNYVDTDSLVLAGGSTMRDSVGNDVSLTLPATGGASSLGTQKNLEVDSLAPTVVRVYAHSDGDQTYSLGRAGYTQMNLRVEFSEAVTVTGTNSDLRLRLEVGGNTQYAYYSGSGSGTNTLSFIYYIGNNDEANPLNYHSTNALTTQGGLVVRDQVNLNAVLTLPALDNANALAQQTPRVVDGYRPRITSVSSPMLDSPGEVYAIGEEVEIHATFNEAVTFTGTVYLRTNISINGVGTSMVSIEHDSDDLDNTATVKVFKYTVQAERGTTDLDVYSNSLTYPLLSGTVQDANQNSWAYNYQSNIAGTMAGARAIVVDGYRPHISSTPSLTPFSPHHREASTIPSSVTVSFTNYGSVTPLDKLNSATLSLDDFTLYSTCAGLAMDEVTYDSGSNTATLTFTGAGTCVNGEWAIVGLDMYGVYDDAGNQGTGSAYVIYTMNTTVLDVSSWDPADSATFTTDAIDVDITFNKNIRPSSVSTNEIDVSGGTCASAEVTGLAFNDNVMTVSINTSCAVGQEVIIAVNPSSFTDVSAQAGTNASRSITLERAAAFADFASRTPSGVNRDQQNLEPGEQVVTVVAFNRFGNKLDLTKPLPRSTQLELTFTRSLEWHEALFVESSLGLFQGDDSFEFIAEWAEDLKSVRLKTEESFDYASTLRLQYVWKGQSHDRVFATQVFGDLDGDSLSEEIQESEEGDFVVLKSSVEDSSHEVLELARLGSLYKLMMAGDLTQSGKTDLVGLSKNSSQIYIWTESRTKPELQKPDLKLSLRRGSVIAQVLSAPDLNQDGVEDLVFVFRRQNQAFVGALLSSQTWWKESREGHLTEEDLLILPLEDSEVTPAILEDFDLEWNEGVLTSLAAR